jgi:hypothetical protein
VPVGAEAVIAQECVHHKHGLLQINVVPPFGSNVRRRGEDSQYARGQRRRPASDISRDMCLAVARTQKTAEYLPLIVRD